MAGSSGRLRTLLLVGTLWQSFFSTGIVYGWAGLLLLLQKHGVYSSLCAGDGPAAAGGSVEAAAAAYSEGGANCAERSVALNLIFSCGAVSAQASGVVVGAVLDRFGPRKTICLGNSVAIFASLLFAESPNTSSDIWTLPVGYALWGFGGNLIHLSGFSMANLFPAASRPTVVSSFVMFFSLSGFTFQILLLINAHAGVTMRVLFRLLALLQCMHLLVSVTLWPALPLQPGDQLALDGWRLQPVSKQAAPAAEGAEPETETENETEAEPAPAESSAPLGSLPVSAQLCAPEFRTTRPRNPPACTKRFLRAFLTGLCDADSLSDRVLHGQLLRDALLFGHRQRAAHPRRECG